MPEAVQSVVIPHIRQPPTLEQVQMWPVESQAVVLATEHPRPGPGRLGGGQEHEAEPALPPHVLGVEHSASGPEAMHPLESFAQV
jgi:hypothetical protein